MKFHFLHQNFNVLNLEKSIKFYDEALGLKVVREKFAEDGSYKIIYLGDGITNFQLELTWLADRKMCIRDSIRSLEKEILYIFRNFIFIYIFIKYNYIFSYSMVQCKKWCIGNFSSI